MHTPSHEEIRERELKRIGEISPYVEDGVPKTSETEAANTKFWETIDKARRENPET